MVNGLVHRPISQFLASILLFLGSSLCSLEPQPLLSSAEFPSVSSDCNSQERLERHCLFEETATSSFTGHDHPVLSCAFSYDEDLIISGDEHGLIYVWRANDASFYTHIEAGMPVIGVAGNSQAVNVLMAGPEQVCMQGWSIQGENHRLRSIDTFQGYRPGIVAGFHANSAVNGTDGGRLEVIIDGCKYDDEDNYDISAGPVMLSWLAHRDSLYRFQVGPVAISKDGDLVASVGFGDPILKVWTIKPIALQYYTQMLARHSSTFPSNSRQFLDCSISILEFSGDGEHLAIGLDNGEFAVWTLAEGDEAELAYFQREDHDTESHKEIISLCFIPNSTKLCAGSADGKLMVVDYGEYQFIQMWQGHQGFINQIAINNNGTQIISCGEDAIVNTWSLAPIDSTE